MKTNILFNAITLESDEPLEKYERKLLIEAIMECLLEDGSLGKLGMLLNRYEHTIQHYEAAVLAEREKQQAVIQMALRELESINQMCDYEGNDFKLEPEIAILKEALSQPTIKDYLTVEAAVLAEREACVKEAEYEAARWSYAPESREPCESIAAAIRARGEK